MEPEQEALEAPILNLGGKTNAFITTKSSLEDYEIYISNNFNIKYDVANRFDAR